MVLGRQLGSVFGGENMVDEHRALAHEEVLCTAGPRLSTFAEKMQWLSNGGSLFTLMAVGWHWCRSSGCFWVGAVGMKVNGPPPSGNSPLNSQCKHKWHIPVDIHICTLDYPAKIVGAPKSSTRWYQRPHPQAWLEIWKHLSNLWVAEFFCGGIHSPSM